LHHYLSVLRGLHLHSATRVFMDIKRVYNTEWKFVRLELSCKSIWLFDRDYFIEWVEFVKEKYKELVKKLPY